MSDVIELSNTKLMLGLGWLIFVALFISIVRERCIKEYRNVCGILILYFIDVSDSKEESDK